MDIGIIPTNKLQATIHLQGRNAGLVELLNDINEHKYNVSNVVSIIEDMIKETEVMLDE